MILTSNMKVTVAVIAGLMCLPLHAVSASPASENGDAALDFLIGVWEGQSTHFFPRREDRAPVSEDVIFDCASVLKGTYVRCSTAWTRRDKKTTRTFLLYVNRVEPDGSLQVLYIYDNWPDHVSYPLRPDSVMQQTTRERVFHGELATTDAEGRRVSERITWTFSSNESVLAATEYNHIDGELEEDWKLAFAFKLTRSSP